MSAGRSRAPCPVCDASLLDGYHSVRPERIFNQSFTFLICPEVLGFFLMNREQVIVGEILSRKQRGD